MRGLERATKVRWATRSHEGTPLTTVIRRLKDLGGIKERRESKGSPPDQGVLPTTAMGGMGDGNQEGGGDDGAERTALGGEDTKGVDVADDGDALQHGGGLQLPGVPILEPPLVPHVAGV